MRQQLTLIAFPLTLLMTVFALSWWLETITFKQTVPNFKRATLPEAIQTSQDFVWQQFGSQGQLKFNLSAKNVTEYSGNSQYQLHDVLLTHYAQNDTPDMTIRSEHATYQTLNDRLTLTDSVVLDMNEATTQRPVKLTTDVLHLYPTKRILKLPERFKLVQGANVTLGRQGHFDTTTMTWQIERVTASFHTTRQEKSRDRN